MTSATAIPAEINETKIRTTSRYVLPQHNDDRLLRPLGLEIYYTDMLNVSSGKFLSGISPYIEKVVTLLSDH